MGRSTGLKSIGYDIDPDIAARFEALCAKHPADPKSWMLEFALDYVTKLKDADFRRLYEPFYQWRSMRKREIKLELAKQRESGPGGKHRER